MKLIAKEQQGDIMLLTFRDENGDIIVQPVALDIWTKVQRVRNKYERKEERALERYIRYKVLEYIDGVSETEALFVASDQVCEMAEKSDVRNRIYEAIELLPEIQKRRVKAYLIEGLTYQQIADSENVYFNAARISIKKAKNNLKKILSGGCYLAP